MSSLRGKTILVTRSDEANAHVADLLRSRGARALSLPTIQFTEPDSWEACDRALREFRNFHAVLFTSSTAVRTFLKRFEAIHPEGKSLLREVHSYAVGERTLESLRDAGIPATMAEGGTAADLAASLGNEVKGKRFLFPKSNIARDVLPGALKARGADVTEVVVYKTVAPSPRALDDVRNSLKAGSVDFVLFFSPSAVSHFTQMIGTVHMESLLVAAIGPTTAHAAQEAGFKVSVVAKKPSDEGLIDSLEEFIAHTPSVKS